MAHKATCHRLSLYYGPSIMSAFEDHPGNTLGVWSYWGNIRCLLSPIITHTPTLVANFILKDSAQERPILLPFISENILLMTFFPPSPFEKLHQFTKIGSLCDWRGIEILHRCVLCTQHFLIHISSFQCSEWFSLTLKKKSPMKCTVKLGTTRRNNILHKRSPLTVFLAQGRLICMKMCCSWRCWNRQTYAW